MTLGNYALGNVALCGSLTASGSADITVSVGRVDVAFSPLAPAVSLGALTVSVSRVDVGALAASPAVALGTLTASVNRVDVPLLTATPSIGLGTLTVSPGRVDVSASIFSPAVALGALTISVGRVDVAMSPQAPVISLGAISVLVGRVNLGLSVPAGSAQIGTLTVSVGRVDLPTSLYNPTATPGPITVSVGRIDVDLDVPTPAVLGTTINVSVERVSISLTAADPSAINVIDIPVAGKNNMRTALLRAQIRGKGGTPVTLRWQEWPDGTPTSDPTTGATLATEENQPVEKSCLTRAWIHYITEGDGRLRQYTEIEIGDCVAEFTAPLMRVATSGDSGLVVGAVVDKWAFNAANRSVPSGGTRATASEIEMETLRALRFVVDGDEWLQPQISDALKKSWDAIVCGLKISRSILLRRA